VGDPSRLFRQRWDPSGFERHGEPPSEHISPGAQACPLPPRYPTDVYYC
jgi:hypothetical protein